MSKGWELKDLAAVAAINYGYTESASSEPVGPRFLRITDVQNDHVDWESVPYCKIEKADLPKYSLASGDIVFARTGATTGKSFLVNDPPDAVFASYLIRLRLLDKKLLPEFVSLFFQTAGYWQSIKDGSSGSAQGGFNATKLGALTIPVPPLPEQHRIVGLLDEAFEGLATAKANAEKNLQNAHALLQYALLAAVRGDLTQEWRKNRQVVTAAQLLQRILSSRKAAWKGRGEYATPNPSPIHGPHPIPDSWVWSNLGQLKIYSLYGPRFSSDAYGNSGVHVLRTTDIDEHGKVNVAAAPRMELCKEDFERYQCKRGDLLITRTGSLGTLAVYNDDAPAIPGAYLIQYRLVLSEVLPIYVFHLLRSPYGQARLTSGAKGAGVPNLNVPTIESIQIPLPPLEEQQAIIDRLREVSQHVANLATIYERKLAALDDLKKSLLHQAFTGQLT